MVWDPRLPGFYCFLGAGSGMQIAWCDAFLSFLSWELNDMHCLYWSSFHEIGIAVKGYK